MDIKYCKYCGLELKWKVKTQEYDRETGDSILHGEVYCPNKHWFLDGHDKFNATKRKGNITIDYQHI